MDPRESVFFWLAVIAYTAAVLSLMAGFAFGKDRAKRMGRALFITGFICHTLAIVFRWIATGHPPVMRHYENALAGAWAVCLFLLFMRKKESVYTHMMLVLLPFTLLMLGYGVMNAPRLEPYTPVFRTPWLVVHIVFAWFSYSSFVITGGLGGIYLVTDSRRRRGIAPENIAHKLDSLDDLGARFIIFGFICSTIMILAGSIWASKLWGSYWNWDPIETWSLISWIIYGIYLHLRFAFKWKGRKMAIIAIAALSTVIISFWGINYVMNTMHRFQVM